MRPECGRPAAEPRSVHSSPPDSDGAKSTVVPPVHGGSCAEPRSERARSTNRPRPRRPAQMARRLGPQTGPQPPQRHSPVPAKGRFFATFGAGDHRAAASTSDGRTRHLRRRPRTGPGPACRSIVDRAPVGPGLSPSRHARHSKRGAWHSKKRETTSTRTSNLEPLPFVSSAPPCTHLSHRRIKIRRHENLLTSTSSGR